MASRAAVDCDADVFQDHQGGGQHEAGSSEEENNNSTKVSARVVTRDVTPDGQVRKDKDGMFVAAIRCPTAVIGLVAGREQRNLKDIVAKHTGLKVEIARRRSEPRNRVESESFIEWLEHMRCSNINVVAPKKDIVEAGLEALTERVRAATRKAPFTHSICLPFLEKENAGFLTNIEKFKKEVLEKCTLERDGIDESVLVSAKQIHFTLLMLKIYDEGTLNQVLNCLTDFVNAIRTKKQGPQFPLRLTFAGVHIFDTDRPDRANVVYTHAGVKTVLPFSSSSTEDMTSAARSLDSTTCLQTAKMLNTVGTRLSNAIASGEVPADRAKSFQTCLSAIPTTVEGLRDLSRTAPRRAPKEADGGTGTQRKERDVSTVSGPQVKEVFQMFSVLVKELSRAGVLTEEDKRERRIFEDAKGEIPKTSLTLHLTLISAKWRSAISNRKLSQLRNQRNSIGKSSRGGFRSRAGFTRPRPLTMDVSNVLDEKFKFGEAVISQMHLSRRSNNGAESLTPEKVFNLC